MRLWNVWVGEALDCHQQKMYLLECIFPTTIMRKKNLKTKLLKEILCFFLILISYEPPQNIFAKPNAAQ